MKKQSITPEQRERQRLYAAEYRAKHKQLPKTPEQLEKRRLWQIEYRKRKPAPKPTPEQKERKAVKQREYRASIKEEKDLHKKAKQARLEAKKLERMKLSQEKKELRRLKNNAKRRPTLAQRGIEAKKRGRKPIPKPPVQKHKHILRPLQKIKEQRNVIPTMQQDLSNKVPFIIPELKLTVFINPGQDTEAVRNKYLKKSL